MKKIYLLSFLLLVGCYSRSQRAQMEADREAREIARNYNPCTDPRFIALREKPIDSLSMREYDFIKTMEDRCNKYTVEQNTSSPFWTAVLITLGVVATIWAISKAGI